MNRDKIKNDCWYLVSDNVWKFGSKVWHNSQQQEGFLFSTSTFFVNTRVNNNIHPLFLTTHYFSCSHWHLLVIAIPLKTLNWNNLNTYKYPTAYSKLLRDKRKGTKFMCKVTCKLMSIFYFSLSKFVTITLKMFAYLVQARYWINYQSEITYILDIMTLRLNSVLSRFLKATLISHVIFLTNQNVPVVSLFPFPRIAHENVSTIMQCEHSLKAPAICPSHYDVYQLWYCYNYSVFFFFFNLPVLL